MLMMGGEEGGTLIGLHLLLVLLPIPPTRFEFVMNQNNF
jgi:hypothetical protein